MIIDDFSKYQIDWLTSHNDIEFNKEEEDLIIRFLRDTAEMYQRENECKDCISRQEAIDAIKKIHPVDTEYDCTLYDKIDVMYVLEDLPSVTPQPKIGKWIEIGIAMEGRKYKNHECDMADAYCCDYCGYNQYIKTNYCPWCGAKMEVLQRNKFDLPEE